MIYGRANSMGIRLRGFEFFVIFPGDEFRPRLEVQEMETYATWRGIFPDEESTAVNSTLQRSYSTMIERIITKPARRLIIFIQRVNNLHYLKRHRIHHKYTKNY